MWKNMFPSQGLDKKDVNLAYTATNHTVDSTHDNKCYDLDL